MLTFECLTVDSADPARLASFWAEMLGWTTHVEDEGEVWIAPPDGGADILFLPAALTKAGKNRLHLDLRPDDRDAEVARALALGASPVDIGQTGEETWVVLSDPEGNEFCILRALNTT
jgi:predicted enzyme related to lactoylglutathione lyase